LIHLAKDKFEGTLTLRLDPKKLKVGQDKKVLANLEECKEFVKKYMEA
jgi:hypothetical protein